MLSHMHTMQIYFPCLSVQPILSLPALDTVCTIQFAIEKAELLNDFVALAD